MVKLLDYLRKRDADKEAAQIIERAEIEAQTRRKEAAVEAREMALKEKARLEAENEEVRRELHDRERKLDKSEDAIQSRADQLAKQEKMVESNQRRLAEKLDDATRRQKELDDLLDLERQTMHQLSGLSREDAETKLLGRLEKELIREQGALIAALRARSRREDAGQGQGNADHRRCSGYAAAHTAESTTSTVDIPNDEMKGRIIGREGRNIRTFEKATGVDVIIDDTPGVVIVSAFDPVRREIARISLNKLIADGRIHPSRIEEVVAETEKEIEGEIRQLRQGGAAGGASLRRARQASSSCWAGSASAPATARTCCGTRSKCRSSAGMMAEEMGLDGELARRAGLLHDIGKAADHEMEGGHPKIGADLLKRFGEKAGGGPRRAGPPRRHPPRHAVHRARAPRPTPCSASRPGARRETLERYIKRLQELETIATGFPGVQQAYAIQAGREVRVIASSRDTTDESAAKICRDIARAIEEQLTYPGEIKVTLIRETRVTRNRRSNRSQFDDRVARSLARCRLSI